MAERIYIPGTVDAVMHIETDGTTHVEHVQDVEGILDYASAGRNHRFSGDSPEGTFRHVAEIPFVVAMKWAQEAGCDLFSDEFSFIMEKKLQSPEYAAFLAAPKTRDPGVIIKGAR